MLERESRERAFTSHATRRGWIAGVAGLGVAACVSPGVQARDGLDRVAQAILADDPIPALSVAVAQGDRIVWARAYGKADLELDVDATAAHRFRLGSLAKPVTASLAALLASRGVFDLDAPISTYLPDLPEQHRATTLRQLLTHRGGVRHYIGRDFDPNAPGGMIDLRAYPDNDAVLAIFINDPLVAAPGTETRYSTFGYTLASIVMAAAAGRPFLDLVRDEIAAPLHLDSLGPDAPIAIMPGRVSGYGPSEQYAEMFPGLEGPLANAFASNPAYKWAGGGLIATPSDVARFGAAHLAPGLLPQAALDELLTPQTPPAAGRAALGLGWRIDADDAGRRRWHHAGSQQGVRASLVVYPDLALSIAFATNLTGRPDDVLTPSARFADQFAP